MEAAWSITDLPPAAPGILLLLLLVDLGLLGSSSFCLQGDHIKVPLKLPNNKGRHWSFTIRVSVSSHVEVDPLFDCKEYNPLHTYGDCIQEELKNIFENFQLVPGSFTNHHHHHQMSSSSDVINSSSDVIVIHYSMSSPNCQNYSGTSKDESSMELEFQFRKRSSLDYNYKTSRPSDGLHPN